MPLDGQKFLEFIDTERFPYLDFYDEVGEMRERVRGPKTGNKSREKKIFNQKSVSKVAVKLRDSAAINKIRICTPCDE